MWATILVALLLSAPAAAPAFPYGNRGHEEAASQQTDTVTAIQVQGNTATPDEEVRRLADVRIGMPFDSATVEAVTARLRAAKRFERVEVLKRFASIADPSQ